MNRELASSYKLLTIVWAVVEIIAYWVIGTFEQVYTSFGAELPWITQLFLSRLWLAVPILSGLLWLLQSMPPAISYQGVLKPLSLILWVLVSLRIAVGIFALYLPIFMLGSVL